MSKENILKRIRAHKPPLVPLPDIPVFESATADLIADFQNVIENGKGHFVQLSDATLLNEYLKKHFHQATSIASTFSDLTTTLDLSSVKNPADLAGIDLTILKATVGVAENGALWVDEGAMVHRVLPFITQHLVLVIERGAVVATMHQAYQQIDIAQTGYGVFIAGPSKTADIEQSLVIGAQGARSLLVVVI